jgi:D-alanyl-D-alanine carboxypeptidase
MKILKGLGKIALTLGGFLIAATGVLFALAPHPPATPRQVKEIAELEAHIEQVVAASSPPGLSIAVVKDGELVYNRAFGMADGPKQQPATVDTVYHWWSMTKIPTAIAMLQLSERGQLTLDDPITQHLPWFSVQAPSASSRPITVRHLLNHSSGLPDTVPAMIGWVHYDDAPRNQTELVKRHLAGFSKLRFEPGSKAIYSNLNYMLLGAVIEAVSGRSYESYISEEILKPLHMEQTGFVYSEAMVQVEAAGTLPVVHLYTPLLPFLLDTSQLIRERSRGIFWLHRVYIDVTPSTGLIGPAPDVARLMLAYLNGGELDGARILSPESVALMTSESHISGEGPNMASYSGGRHGLGWYIIPAGTQPRLQHDGAGPGFATTMRLYPEKGLGIAILANGTDLDRDGLADRLAEVEWGGQP